jgi:hypothetical protein
MTEALGASVAGKARGELRGPRISARCEDSGAVTYLTLARAFFSVGRGQGEGTSIQARGTARAVAELPHPNPLPRGEDARAREGISGSALGPRAKPAARRRLLSRRGAPCRRVSRRCLEACPELRRRACDPGTSLLASVGLWLAVTSCARRSIPSDGRADECVRW